MEEDELSTLLPDLSRLLIGPPRIEDRLEIALNLASSPATRNTRAFVTAPTADAPSETPLSPLVRRRRARRAPLEIKAAIEGTSMKKDHRVHEGGDTRPNKHHVHAGRDGEGGGRRAGRRPRGWCVTSKWNVLIQGEVVHVI